MFHDKPSSVSNGRYNDHSLQRTSPPVRLQLHLQYNSQSKKVSVVKTASFSTMATIREVVNDFLILARSDISTPKDIILVSFDVNRHTYSVPTYNASMTLSELKIMDGYKLFFEPSSSQSRSQLLKLTIYGPDAIKSVRYECDKSSTTLGMLFDYVIQTFSLGSIERERIHLFMSPDEELNMMEDSGKLLTQLGITDRSFLNVQIIPSLSTSITGKNSKVHVECAYIDGMLSIDVSGIDTIGELQDQIAEKFQGRVLIDFTLSDNMYRKINLSDPGRMLFDLGIKPGQTIYASTRLTIPKVSLSSISSRVDVPSSSSLAITRQDDEVTVICKFSDLDSKTFRVSVKDTIAVLTAKIAALSKDRSLPPLLFHSSKAYIDNTQPYRCLADFGVKPGSVIHVATLDTTPTYTSIVSNGRYNDHSLQHTSPPVRLQLHLQYNSQSKKVSVVKTASFSTMATIREVVNDFLILARSDISTPKDIILVSFDVNRHTYSVPTYNASMTLSELKIMDGYKLFFEPSSSLSRSQLLKLTIYGPDAIKSVRYECDKSSTTLGMLFDYVIQTFSLGSIERERIHLFMSPDEELNMMEDSGKLLTQLGITDRSFLNVQIIPSLSSSITGKNSKVHVECAYIDGMLSIDVSGIDTIGELQDQIAEKFQGRVLIDFTLSDNMYRKINLSDPGRMLFDLGIKPGQTIYASTRLTIPKVSLSSISSRVDVPSSSSLAITRQDDEVTVICKFSDLDTITFRVSVKDTIAVLTAKIAALSKDRSLPPLLFHSSKAYIDNTQPYRCLADFGVKPGSVIHVATLDTTPTYTSIVSRRSTGSRTQTRQYQDDSKPIGLDNLGNTCFMNSALQCLVHVKPLTEFFLNDLIQAHSDDGGGKDNVDNPFNTCGDVTGAYAELIWNLWLSDRNTDYFNSFKPDRLKEAVGCLAPRFASWDQQDAQEFLTFLLNTIHDELKKKNKSNRNTIINQLFFGDMQSTVTCLECKHVEKTSNPFGLISLPLNRQECIFSINFVANDGKPETAVVLLPACARIEHLVQAFCEQSNNNLFYHVFATTKNTSEPLEFDTSLSELPDREVTLIEQDERISRIRPDRYETQPYRMTLEECLREFVSVEELEDLRFCQQKDCKRNSKATKQLQLTTLPPVLVIQLKRFSHHNGVRQKIETMIEYPVNGLDLSSFLPSSGQAIYDLIAVSNHVGSISYGHYTAFARRAVDTDKWYKFNDSYVSDVYYADDIVSRDAYLLFYIKRNVQKQSSETQPGTS